MKPTEHTPKVCNSNNNSADDKDDNTMEDLPGLLERGRKDSISDDDSDDNQDGNK